MRGASGVRRLLAGTAGVGIGTVVLGASGYGFLTLTAAAVSPADYDALASLYLTVAIVGPGLFMPVEQETTRIVTSLLAQGRGTRQVIVQLGKLTGVLLAVAAAGLAAAGPLLVAGIFGDHAGLWWALLLSVVGYGATSVARGVLAAHGRYGPYGLVLGVDGLVRLLPCVALAVAGVDSPVAYGLALGLGPVAGLLVALATTRLGERGPGLVWRELIASTSWLAVAWAVSVTLANVGPVIATALLPAEPGRAGTFAFAFVLVRVPLFLLYAVQPILLPALARATANQDAAGLRRGIGQAMLLVGALGAALLVVAAPLVGWLIRALFRDAPVPSGATITALAAGTVLAMLVQVLQPALLAVASHRLIAAAWVAGAVSFGVPFLFAVDAISAATLAQLAAGLVTAVVMAAALGQRLRAERRAIATVTPVAGQVQR
jgi:O-antigen/teichoic acid export membrane protein